MLGLRTTIYKVPDLQKAKEWYAKAFSTDPYFDQPFYVGFNVEGYELGQIPDDSKATIRSDNVLTYWGVKEIQLEYDRLISLGASEHEKPTNVGENIMTATVKDPWNNVIGLIYNPHFKLQ